MKLLYSNVVVYIFFFKQKTAYEVRISDWSSDVCSSDLSRRWLATRTRPTLAALPAVGDCLGRHIDAVGLERAQHDHADRFASVERSEESRVGKECVSTCRSRWSPYH